MLVRVAAVCAQWLLRDQSPTQPRGALRPACRLCCLACHVPGGSASLPAQTPAPHPLFRVAADGVDEWLANLIGAFGLAMQPNVHLPAAELPAAVAAAVGYVGHAVAGTLAELEREAAGGGEPQLPEAGLLERLASQIEAACTLLAALEKPAVQRLRLELLLQERQAAQQQQAADGQEQQQQQQQQAADLQQQQRQRAELPFFALLRLLCHLQQQRDRTSAQLATNPTAAVLAAESLVAEQLLNLVACLLPDRQLLDAAAAGSADPLLLVQAAVGVAHEVLPAICATHRAICAAAILQRGAVVALEQADTPDGAEALAAAREHQDKAIARAGRLSQQLGRFLVQFGELLRLSCLRTDALRLAWPVAH